MAVRISLCFNTSRDVCAHSEISGWQGHVAMILEDYSTAQEFFPSARPLFGTHCPQV